MKPPVDNFIPKAYPAGSITQFFGENPAMYQKIGLQAHNGIDVVAEWDSPLYAIEGGIVLEVKRAPDGYGRHLRILSKNCREWTYGHCEQIFVEVNQEISAGQKIATMGNTGFVVSSSYANTFWGVSPAKPSHPGTHLHLGLRKVKRSAKGWSYPGSRIKIDVLNYDNGYKGAVDPIPELTAGKQDSVRETQLETIGLLQKIVSLYQLLLQK